MLVPRILVFIGHMVDDSLVVRDAISTLHAGKWLASSRFLKKNGCLIKIDLAYREISRLVRSTFGLGKLVISTPLRFFS